MSNEKRRRFLPEQKVQIIRETLKNHIPVSEICQKYNISPNVYYRWEKEFFERGVDAFNKKGNKSDKTSSKEKKLLDKIKRQQDVIAILTEENIALKKSADGDI